MQARLLNESNAAYAACLSVFGTEFQRLSLEDSWLVAEDFELANWDDGCTAREYAARIGSGNLAAYTACLRIAKRERDAEQLRAELQANTQ